MGVKKSRSKKSSKIGRAAKSAVSAVGGLLGGKSRGGGMRRRSRETPEKLAKKILILKLKKKLYKMKYGGR